MTSACEDAACEGCAVDAEVPPKLNGAGDPMLLRLLQVGGPDDARDEAAVLSELAEIAGARAAIEGSALHERRRSDLWIELLELRDKVATGEPKARELLDQVAKVREANEPLPPAAEHAAALRYAPPDVHIPTGLQTLDAITEGGLLSGRLHVIAGEPNLGKTSLATQMARYACEDGWVVGFHVADVDDRRGILQRIAQAHGVDRRAFLERNPSAIEQTERIVRRWPGFRIIDEAADHRTVDESAEAILALGTSMQRRAVLYVDSLQTVRMRWKDEPRTDKDRIDRILRALVPYTRRGLTIVATCEVPRSVYGGPKRRRKFDPSPPAMAAFKGSGNIEYALWTGLVLTRIKDDPDAVRIEVPKNKQGREDVTFRLTRSESRVGYEDRGEIDENGEGDASARPKPPGQDEFDARLEKAASELVPKVIAKLAAAGSKGMSRRELRDRIVGKNAAIDRAVELSVEQGLAVTRFVKGFERLFVPSAAPNAPQSLL
jgi:archaellum biogenesis ATPase FlaH